MTHIEATDIVHRFGDNTVLDGISLSVRPGEAVGIVGPNGAGKTTLLKVLAGLLRPDAGAVSLDGDDLQQLTRRQIAARIAVVPQATPQVFDYTVLEFVLMGRYTRSSRFVPGDDDIAAGRAALEQLQLTALSHRSVSRISGGELQRALIARAAVSAAPMWLLDEPTASLDVCHRATVLERMRQHVHNGGAALAVLHDLELVHRYFDRVLPLCDARLLADGSPDQVLTESLVSRMYGVAMRRGTIGDHVVWVAD